MGSNPIWGTDYFCVLLWLILYISLSLLYYLKPPKTAFRDVFRLCLVGYLYLNKNALTATFSLALLGDEIEK